MLQIQEVSLEGCQENDSDAELTPNIDNIMTGAHICS